MKNKKEEKKHLIDCPLGGYDSNSPSKKRANDAVVENIGGKESNNNSYSTNKECIQRTETQRRETKE